MAAWLNDVWCGSFQGKTQAYKKNMKTKATMFKSTEAQRILCGDGDRAQMCDTSTPFRSVCDPF